MIGNPIRFIDPDGKEVRIYLSGHLTDSEGNYIDNDGNKVSWWNRVKASGYITYQPGMEKTNRNAFADDAITALNHIIEKGADINGIINSLISSTEHILPIFDGGKYGSYFNSNYSNSDPKAYAYIKWSSRLAVTFHKETAKPSFKQYWFEDDKWGKRSPTEALFHEIAHAYSHFSNPSQHDIEGKQKDETYSNFEEYEAISNYENPAVSILRGGNKFIERVHHGGSYYKVNSPLEF